MNKTFRMMGLVALAVLALAACKKNEQKDTVSLKATLPPTTCESKTEIGTDNWLWWSSGDQIVMYAYTNDLTSGTAARNFTVATADVGKTSATFTGDEALPEADYYKAFYPATNVELNEENRPVIHMDSVQSFVNGSFATNTYPMFGNSIDGQSVDFFSPCGVLAIPMKGTANVGRIVLKDKYLQGLVGDIVPLNESDGTNHEFESTARSVTLDCGEGVQLSEAAATTFYFVVAPSAFMGGFTIDVYDTEDNIVLTKTTTNNCMILPMRIRVMGEVQDVNALVPVYAAVTDTVEVANVFPISMTLKGYYSLTYAKSVTETGFYWGLGADLSNRVTATASSGNAFTYTIASGLAPATDYSYQAYIKVGDDELLGAVKVFHTPDPRFSVSATQKVYFSPGNLQYQPMTGTWRFAEHQYDFVGGICDPTYYISTFPTQYGNVYEGGVRCQNNLVTDPSYTGWIDYFAWGTGNEPTNLIGTTTFTDWGVNIPSSTTPWRTLDIYEWTYVFVKEASGGRHTTALFGDNIVNDQKYAFCIINGDRGVVLFPDEYYHPLGVQIPVTFLNPSGYVSTPYTYDKYLAFAAEYYTTYSLEDWAKMERNGAVFLPAVGNRWQNQVDLQMNSGGYWTSTSFDYWTPMTAAVVTITTSQMSIYPSRTLDFGQHVRLVRNAE